MHFMGVSLVQTRFEAAWLAYVRFQMKRGGGGGGKEKKNGQNRDAC